jgi:general secretion pathway protein B
MSYILDALRKADAERERGSVPDLHAQLLPQVAGAGDVGEGSPGVLRWVVVGVGLALVAGAAWFWLGRDVSTAAAPQAPPAIAAAPPQAAMPPAPPPPQAEAPPAPPPAAPAEPAPPSAVAEAAPPAPPPVPKKAEVKKAEVKKADAKKTDTKKDEANKAEPKKAEAAPPKPAAPATKSEPAPPPAPLPALADLPPDLRQQVPPLVVGGSVYSPQASARMVVINGQVFQEGNPLTPELKLEQIRAKSAVFSIRGQRFEVPL